MFYVEIHLKQSWNEWHKHILFLESRDSIASKIHDPYTLMACFFVFSHGFESRNNCIQPTKLSLVVWWEQCHFSSGTSCGELSFQVRSTLSWSLGSSYFWARLAAASPLLCTRSEIGLIMRDETHSTHSTSRISFVTNILKER